jgi:hypothetical protein
MASDGTGFAGRSFAPSNVAVAIGPVGLGGLSGASPGCGGNGKDQNCEKGTHTIFIDQMRRILERAEHARSF